MPASRCGTEPRLVSTRGTLRLRGRGLRAGMAVAFPRARFARISRHSPSAGLRASKLGLVVTVPSSAHTGRIEIVLAHGGHSNLYGPIQVVTHALHPPAPRPKPKPKSKSKSKRAPTPAPPATPSGTAFDGQGMWIWYMSHSDGGNVSAIAKQAHAAGVGTLFVKSSDGSTNYWSQFSPQLVAAVHAAGLKICAWQFVYGTNPVGEADLGAEAVANGADCLVIDAEGEYENKYGAAQTYLTTLRAKIGANYPLGLASFPYVDYHEAFPYSVFLGPGGAQFNAPQMYWKAIGTSVANVFVHTYEENLIYGAPIVPLGQTYEGPSTAELVAFRSLVGVYRAPGLSFWDWQETSAPGWAALAAPLNPEVKAPATELTSPLLRQGARGDQVLWLQEHLARAISSQPTSGIFEATTTANIKQFQSAHALPPTGETDASTWGALLLLQPVPVDWTGAGPKG
ncbi:MAG: peptidoglycan-binding protein [Solirubrobacterales bacterium]|nr:peptidoglycan-binding protein [Solirubrobacterales bacterium]